MKFPRKKVFGILVATLFGLNGCIWYLAAWEGGRGLLTVAFLDIGQGDAIFIETPSGKQMLIDGGPGNALMRKLSREMPVYDRSLDLVVVSNPDKDHIEGFVSLLENYSVDAFLEPGTIQVTGVYRALMDSVAEKGIRRITARRGMVISLDHGITFTVLFPDRDAGKLSTNTGSLVGRLSYGNISFMFPGDAPEEIEDYLVALQPESLKSTVLKAGHHGSKTSTGELFLQKVKPSYAVISSGAENKYGHPHKEVTDRLAAAGIATLRTDREGTVVFKTDGRTLFRD